MSDQAAHLRSLVLRSMREHAAELGVPARVVAVTGGQPRVGTTSVAISVALAFAENGLRVVLVDANLSEPAIAQMCSATGSGNLSDVLSRRRDIHEVLQRGPAGIQLVTGADASRQPFSPVALHRLIKQLKMLGRHADVVVVDAGHGASEVAKGFWQTADEVMLVSTADDQAVKAAYKTLKLMVLDEIRPTIHLLLNQVESAEGGRDVYERMNRCTREHLHLELRLMGCVGFDRAAELSVFPRPADGSIAKEIQRAVAGMIADGSVLTSAHAKQNKQAKVA